MTMQHPRRARWTGVLLTTLLLGGTAAEAPAQGEGYAPAEIQLKLGALEYALGSATAPVTLVEFTDYQCPFCAKFHAETRLQIERDYVATGKVSRQIVSPILMSLSMFESVGNHRHLTATKTIRI